MTPTRWQAVASVFDQAAALPPADRPAFLDAACRTPDGAPDTALRDEVERLLALDAGAETFFDRLHDDLQPGAAPPPTAGPWRLVERIGEGGMGEVWRAERSDGAYAQTAAVKLVRPGLGADLLARFRAERHVLARLHHPAIARLLDGGTASDGRPYLALEYVHGEPITAYADRHRLSVAERLALFQEVCAAVAAAHRQLVVHRDLKPSNILVTSGDEGRATEDGEDTADARTPHRPSPIPHRPTVKLLDFGIAKLLDDDAGFTVALTAADRRVMTPEYAAPEQVRGEPATTATDVYGLGVLLYELLTGSRPYRLDSRVRHAVEQAILEAEPTEPSTAVTGATEAASARATEPARLRRQLQGDLDQIVLKALRKEPERRYDGAAALAADLHRHLSGLPVEARPESLPYRAGKFVRRHRAGVAAAAAVLAALVLGAGAALWQARTAAAERDRAADRAAEAEAVTGFLAEMLADARPPGSDGDTLRVRDVLDAGAARLDTSFQDRPLVQATLAMAFGRAYAGLGRSADALPLFQRAFETRRAHLGRTDTLTMFAEDRYSVELLNQRDHLTLDSLMTDALAARRAALGAWHPMAVKALATLGLSANANRADSARSARAPDFFREALAVAEGPDSARYAAAMDSPADARDARSDLHYSLAAHYLERGQPEQAVEPMRRAVELSTEPLSSLSRQMLENGYGVLLRTLERYDESIAVHRRVTAAARAAHGPDHPMYGHTVLSLGSAYYAADRYEEATRTLRDALRIFGGPASESPTALEVRYYLGESLVKGGQAAEGRAVLRAALPGLLRIHGPESRFVTNTQKSLGQR